MLVILCTKDNGNYKSVHKLKYYSGTVECVYGIINVLKLSLNFLEGKQTTSYNRRMKDDLSKYYTSKSCIFSKDYNAC